MNSQIRIKDHKKDQRLVHGRMLLSMSVVLLLFVLLLARMYFLQVVQHDYHSILAENNRIHVQSLPPTRGLIYDRSGVVLAENRPSYSLTFTKERAGEDWLSVLHYLADVFSLDDELLEQLEQRIKSRRPFEPVPIVFELSEEQIALVAVNQPRLPGVEVTAQLVRHYPKGSIFSHAIGYVGRINEDDLKRLDRVNYTGTHHVGKIGVERFYEDQLHGNVGYEEVETNARGRVLRVLNRTEPQPGKDIYLTLDYELQKVAKRALAGRRGAVVALEPATGEVLAMVSEPSFDPNLFVTGISYKAYGELRDSIDQPLFNRVLRGLYPPGSTIKPMVVIAGLDSEVLERKSRVFDPGFYQLPNNEHKYRNWNRFGDGWVDLELAIARSNDTFFYDLAFKLGVDRLYQYMSEFGFGQRVGLDVFGESAGLMPSREWKRLRFRQPWYPGETLILGIGQGYMQTTPLQLAHAASLMATRGRWVRPRLAKMVGDERVVDPVPHADIRLKDEKYWDWVHQAMVSVVHGKRGTAQGIGRGSPYRVAGKSGTAQVVAIKQGEKYDRDKVRERHRDHALFIAYAPAEQPEIAVAVMIENGESGSAVAAPAAKMVMDAWLLRQEGPQLPVLPQLPDEHWLSGRGHEQEL